MSPTGPVKGAVALCNGLAAHLPVTLVSLKSSVQAVSGLLDSVSVLNLAEQSSWLDRYRVYKRVLADAGGRHGAVSLSFCLPADPFNLAFRGHARIVSSVRANLFENYKFDFGRKGRLMAQAHYKMLGAFDEVFAISAAMHAQLTDLGLTNIRTIHNFVDEAHLQQFRLSTIPSPRCVRLVFVGSLSARKQPGLLLDALHKLLQRDIECELVMVGDGPLRQALEKQAREMGLTDRVEFCGSVDDPYGLIQSAHLMVLPSRSEGVSRAMLEALYFGVPCVARRVDANEELIRAKENGFCFERDDELVDVLEQAIEHFVPRSPDIARRDVLVPSEYRREPNIQRILEALA